MQPNPPRRPAHALGLGRGLALALALAAVAGGCAGQPAPATDAPAPTDDPGTPPPTGTPPTGDDDDDDVTADTADTAATLADCAAPLPIGPLPYTTLPVRTEEDFDFDLDGRLVAQDGASLVGYRMDGSVELISPNVGADAAGIRALATGDYVVAQPDTGVVKLVYGASGATRNAMTGLTAPNGVEAGRDGLVYIGEFSSFGSLLSLDPYSGAERTLVDGEAVNAVGLSPDEATLYISSHGYFGAGAFDGVATLERAADGTWSAPQLIVPTTSLIQGLTTDVCGNLYAVSSHDGLVVRYNIADGSVDELVDLGDGGLLSFYSSARFSPGFGGFSRTALYVTDRTRIYAIEVGIEGRHILAP